MAEPRMAMRLPLLVPSHWSLAAAMSAINGQITLDERTGEVSVSIPDECGVILVGVSGHPTTVMCVLEVEDVFHFLGDADTAALGASLGGIGR